jgi:hypothetical protein
MVTKKDPFFTARKTSRKASEQVEGCSAASSVSHSWTHLRVDRLELVARRITSVRRLHGNEDANDSAESERPKKVGSESLSGFASAAAHCHGKQRISRSLNSMWDLPRAIRQPAISHNLLSKSNNRAGGSRCHCLSARNETRLGQNATKRIHPPQL